MSPADSLLAQIARLENQNRVEPDPDLQRENKKTIKALHKELRKAAKYRSPEHRFSRAVAVMLALFFAAVLAFLGLANKFGWKSTTSACVLIALVLGLIIVTILRVTGRISEVTFKELFRYCVGKLTGDEESKKTPNEPERFQFAASVVPEDSKKDGDA